MDSNWTHAVLGGVTSNALAQAEEPKKVSKKKRKKRMKKRGFRLSQLLGGMTDVEKSRWMLEHCKVACVASCHALAGLCNGFKRVAALCDA